MKNETKLWIEYSKENLRKLNQYDIGLIYYRKIDEINFQEIHSILHKVCKHCKLVYLLCDNIPTNDDLFVESELHEIFQKQVLNNQTIINRTNLFTFNNKLSSKQLQWLYQSILYNTCTLKDFYVPRYDEHGHKIDYTYDTHNYSKRR